MATDEDLPFKVEQWDRDGRIERVIASTANVSPWGLPGCMPSVPEGAAHTAPGNPGHRGG